MVPCQAAVLVRLHATRVKTHYEEVYPDSLPE